MRLEAGSWEALQIQLVLHVPTARALKRVAWVDDETAQWWAYDEPLTGAGTTHQAKRIEIHLDKGVILIDPVEDAGPAEELQASAVHAQSVARVQLVTQQVTP